jgi:hypothetical protein
VIDGTISNTSEPKNPSINPWEASRKAIEELSNIGDDDYSPLKNVLIYIQNRWKVSINFKDKGKP